LRSDDPVSRSAAPNPGTTDRGGLALVLTGGGARGAYQVGVLRSLVRRFPALEIPIMTGVSAGAVNAAYLAQHRGSNEQATADLASLWSGLSTDRVFDVDARGLVRNMGRWGLQLAGAGVRESRVRGLVDTAPLWDLLGEALGQPNGELTGIEYNLRRGTLRAVALSTTSYTTGQSVVWVQGQGIETWERPQRRSVMTRLSVEHVMASTALPLFFPAVQIGTHWYGDGGVRLTAPLSPALHLGAHRILAVSTRYPKSFEEADVAEVGGYPPPAQVLGVLYNAVFLDLIDQDALRMERMNQMIRALPPEKRDGMRPVELLVLRPSRDLAALARGYEPRLPRAFRLLTRGLGTRETTSPDVLSMIMFQSDYMRSLIELGEEDGERRAEEVGAFLESGAEG
jgi:NTE family protein